MEMSLYFYTGIRGAGFAMCETLAVTAPSQALTPAQTRVCRCRPLKRNKVTGITEARSGSGCQTIRSRSVRPKFEFQHHKLHSVPVKLRVFKFKIQRYGV